MSIINKKRLITFATVTSLALGAFALNDSSSTVEASTDPVTRIQGDDRYETATLISRKSYSSSNTVIIANAMEFADALSGVPLAYQKDAPILLAYGAKLKTSIIAEINRLGASEAIILGGEAAVNSNIEQELRSLGLTTRRLAGSNRFETAVVIAEELNKGLSSSKAVVVDGMEFADAMSIAPFAAREGMPIYLTKSNSLGNAEALDNYDETYIIGGTNAVSISVENELNKPTRLEGGDRYQTNIAVLNHFGVDSTHLYLATGMNFADALTGSVLAASDNSGMALVKGDVNSNLLNYLNKQSFGAFTILGGEAAVPKAVVNSLKEHLGIYTEYNDTVYPSGIYEVGKDISAGEYKVYALSDYAYLEVALDSSGDLNSVITNELFSTFSYITVREGEYLLLQEMEAISVTAAKPYSPVNGKYGEGKYKVGVDIPAGEYNVIATEELAYIEVAKDSYGTVDSIITSDMVQRNKYITVQNGQYFTITGGYTD